MNLRKKLAALTAFALGAGTVALGVAIAPAAQAGEYQDDYVLGCTVYIGPNPQFFVNYDDEFTLSTSPTNPASGDTVTVTFEGAEGLANVAPVGFAANTMTLRAVFDLDEGGPAKTVTLTGATNTYPTSTVAAGGRFGGYTLTGTYTAAAADSVLALKQFVMDDSSGTNADSYCTDANTVPAGNTDPPTGRGEPVPGVNANTAPVVSKCIVAVQGDAEAPTCGPITSPPPTSPSPSTTTPPTSPPPTTPAGSDIPSTVTKQVADVSCQVFTGSDGKLWQAKPAQSNPQSQAVDAPKFTVALTPQEPKPGEKVNVEVTYDVGPGNGPQELSDPSVLPKAALQLGGDMNEIIVVEAREPAGTILSTGEDPNSRIPVIPMFGEFTFPNAEDAVVTAKLVTIGFDSGPNDLDPTGSFKWPEVTDQFDVICNKSIRAKDNQGIKPLTAEANIDTVAIGVTAGVPYSGVVTDAPATPDDPNNNGGGGSDPDADGGDTNGSGGELASTGPRDTIIIGLIALAALQLGAIFVVRAYRSAPVRGRHL